MTTVIKDTIGSCDFERDILVKQIEWSDLGQGYFLSKSGTCLTVGFPRVRMVVVASIDVKFHNIVPFRVST